MLGPIRHQVSQSWLGCRDASPRPHSPIRECGLQDQTGQLETVGLGLVHSDVSYMPE